MTVPHGALKQAVINALRDLTRDLGHSPPVREISGYIGTRGVAAMLEGFESILIEREADYVADIERKVAFYRGEGRLAIQEKGKAKNDDASDLPLFGGEAA